MPETEYLTLDVPRGVNVDLLTATLDHIEAHPEQWNQDFYRCGSGMCFAGWAAELAGGRWADSDPDADWSDLLLPEDGDEAGHNGLVSAADRAQRVLGLDDSLAEALFDPHNRLTGLRALVAHIVRGTE